MRNSATSSRIRSTLPDYRGRAVTGAISPGPNAHGHSINSIIPYDGWGTVLAARRASRKSPRPIRMENTTPPTVGLVEVLPARVNGFSDVQGLIRF